MIELVDVSNWQGVGVVWKDVADTGIVAAYVKATEGVTYASPAFLAQVNGARDAGLRVGAYHYLTHDVDPVAQAHHFISVYRDADPTGAGLGCVPALDVERAWQGGDGMCAAAALAWLQMVQAALGVAPMLYTYGAFARAFQSIAALASFPLWLARYREKWPPAPNPWAEVTMHQYTGTGRVPGIAGNADRSRARD